MSSRHVGINVPLFSLRSDTGWGIGELPDVLTFADWLAQARIDRLLLLPIGTMPEGETSPYSALSTLALDPIYIRLTGLEDFERAGGLGALTADARGAIDRARASAGVNYAAVRRAKSEALGNAFARFLADDWQAQTPRAHELSTYIAREHWWLDDYALFQVISSATGGTRWTDWEAPLRDRDPQALDEVRRHSASEVLRQQYYQWIAEQQWHEVRRGCRIRGVQLFGDLPFVAAVDSAEVWARAHEFMLDVSCGAPPDAFSTTGQDWGLPTYRWDVIRASNYDWLRHRSLRMAALYDGLRVDHTIGLYRTYGRPRDGGEPFFTPSGEEAQIAQGERIMRTLLAPGLVLVAEDLGVVPDFLSASLASLGVPGCRVLRWERDWKASGHPFIDPQEYPARSAAMTGTHDTEPLSVWWDTLPGNDREAVLALPIFGARGMHDPQQAWSDELRDVFLDLAYHAGSNELFLPIQDVFGWRGRINEPGTVGGHNWTWTLPWSVDGLASQEDAGRRAAFLDGLAHGTARGRLVAR